MSHEIVLKLQSLDFGSVFGREDDVGRVHGLLPIHNLDLDRGIPACLDWCANHKGHKHNLTISFSPFLEGAVSLVPLPGLTC